MVYKSRRQRRGSTTSRSTYTPRERPEKSDFQKITESFSWRLVLLFAGFGVVAWVVLKMFVSDYDEMGVVLSGDDLRLIYETQGDGPPLVTLAGGAGQQPPRLPSLFRSVASERHGHLLRPEGTGGLR